MPTAPTIASRPWRNRRTLPSWACGGSRSRSLPTTSPACAPPRPRPAAMEIAAGEYGYEPFYFRRMLQAEAVDVLQADATRCRGITGFLEADAIADAFAMPLSAHTAPALHKVACCAASSAEPRVLPRPRSDRTDVLRRRLAAPRRRPLSGPLPAGLGTGIETGRCGKVSRIATPPMDHRPATRKVIAWTTWWLASMAFYLLLAAKVARAEIVVGAGACGDRRHGSLRDPGDSRLALSPGDRAGWGGWAPSACGRLPTAASWPWPFAGGWRGEKDRPAYFATSPSTPAATIPSRRCGGRCSSRRFRSRPTPSSWPWTPAKETCSYTSWFPPRNRCREKNGVDHHESLARRRLRIGAGASALRLGVRPRQDHGPAGRGGDGKSRRDLDDRPVGRGLRPPLALRPGVGAVLAGLSFARWFSPISWSSGYERRGTGRGGLPRFCRGRGAAVLDRLVGHGRRSTAGCTAWGRRRCSRPWPSPWQCSCGIPRRRP